MADKAKILIVEDEVILAASMERELARRGYRICESACTEDQAMRQLAAEQPDLIVLDCCLGCEDSGFDIAGRIRSLSDIPIVFMSGLARSEIADRIDAVRGASFLAKPFNPDGLVAVIEAALRAHRGQAA